MTTTTPPIPTLKSIYDQVEAFWTKPLHTMLGTESAAAAMSLVREQTLNQQQAQRAQLEAYWEALRLPSKVDHARLAAQVVALEAKIEGVEDRLDTVVSQLERVLDRLAAVPAVSNKAEGAERKSEPASKTERKKEA